MFELWKADPLPVQIDSKKRPFYEDKKFVYVIGVIVVFIAAFMMFFTIKDYIHKLNENPKICAQQCSTEICEITCNFKKSTGATVNVLIIFIFMLVILGVYFAMTHGLGD